MRILPYFVFLCMMLGNLNAQTDTLHYFCVDNPLDYDKLEGDMLSLFSSLAYAPNKVEMDGYASKINARYDFHNTMKTIRTPSTISSFTNWKVYRRGNARKPFVMQADINFPIAIPGMGKWGYTSIHVIPRFRFRIFRNDDFEQGLPDSSNPVRTPSAIPGIAWYYTPHQWWENKVGHKLTRKKYFGIYLFHHSNGQDGCEIYPADEEQQSELPCIEGLANGINTYNGNFGEQLVIEFIIGSKNERFRYKPFSYENKRRKFQTKIDDRIAANLLKVHYAKSTDFHWRLGYELHPRAWSNSSFSQYELYGRHRINLDFNLINYLHRADFITDGIKWCLFRPKYRLEQWRHHFELSYILDFAYKRAGNEPERNLREGERVRIYNVAERLNINYSLYYVLPGWKNFAVFGQVGYLGSDVYNIYFEESYGHARLGIAFGFFDQPALFRKVTSI